MAKDWTPPTFSSLSIGRAIVDYIDSKFGEYLDEVRFKYYPVVSPSDTTMPYIVYRRTGVQTRKSNYIVGFDTCAVRFSIYTSDYAEGVCYAEILRHILERTYFSTVYSASDYFSVRSSLMTESSEESDGSAYVQNLTFEFIFEHEKELNVG